MKFYAVYNHVLASGGNQIVALLMNHGDAYHTAKQVFKLADGQFSIREVHMEAPWEKKGPAEGTTPLRVSRPNQRNRAPIENPPPPAAGESADAGEVSSDSVAALQGQVAISSDAGQSGRGRGSAKTVGGK